MSYIGNQPLYTSYVADRFSGNGSTVSYTLSIAPANSASLLVAIYGVLQDPTAYGVVGNTLTFTSAPPAGTNNISVRYLGLPASNVVTSAYRTVTDIIATAGQTTFSTASYTPGFIDVYRNGSKLATADYTATNGAQVVLLSAATAGDIIQTVSFSVGSALNAIPANAGVINSGYLADSAVTSTKLAGASVTATALDVGNGNGTGAMQLPTGTSGQRPGTSVLGQLRYNTASVSPEYYTGSAWVSLGAKDGTSAAKAALKSTDILLYNPSAPTGWYWLQINGIATQVYVDNVYSGGGWVLVANHAFNVSLPQLTYAQTTAATLHQGSSGFTIGSGNPKQYTTLMPLRQWTYITGANVAGNNFVYFTAGSQVELGDTGSHSRRSKWAWTGWSGTYAWQGLSGLTNEVGGTTPGLYSSHAATGASWTTYDNDQDSYGSNCSTLYNNAPWWYNACWDGNFWGGNGSGYQNAAFWTGSGSDYYTYGAFYVK